MRDRGNNGREIFVGMSESPRNYSTFENSQQRTQSISCILVSNSTDRAVNGDSVFCSNKNNSGYDCSTKKKPQIHFFPNSISWYSNCILELIKIDSGRDIMTKSWILQTLEWHFFKTPQFQVLLNSSWLWSAPEQIVQNSQMHFTSS